MNMTMFHRLLGLIAVAAQAALISSLAFAQAAKPPDTGSPEVTQSCPGLVATNRPRILPASFDVAALDADHVRITYVGHATFLIERARNLCISRLTTTILYDRR
jgi:hypothetical protein